MPREAPDQATMRRLIDLGGSLVANLELESLLPQVVAAARELTGARYAALGVLDRDRKELERFITDGIDPATRARIGDLPRGRGVLGLLIKDPRPIRLSEVSEHPDSFGFPAAHPPMHTFLGVPIMIGGEAYGNLYLTDKQSGEFDQADEELTMMLAGWVAIAIENARLYNKAEEGRKQLESAVQSLEATTEISLALGGETDIDRVLELIAKRGRTLVNAQSLLIMLADRGHLEVVATAGSPPTEVAEARIPIEDTLPGDVLRRGRPELVPDTSARLRLALGDHLGVLAKSAIMVPLIFRGDRLGIVVGIDRTVEGPRFTERDARLLQGFAASAAIAVATARSVQRDLLRSSIDASERERRRWARELHDETLQGLGGLQVLLSSASRKGDPESLGRATRQAIDQIAVEIANLRSLITELRPAALDEIGLRPALESLVNRAMLQDDIKVETDFQLEPTVRLEPELESTVYRLVQESLTNTSKHASASHVWLRIAPGGNDYIEVSVRDDGIGFEPEATTSGFGLIGMRERVALAGGELDVYSAPGSGTTVRALMPARDATAGIDAATA